MPTRPVTEEMEPYQAGTVVPIRPDWQGATPVSHVPEWYDIRVPYLETSNWQQMYSLVMIVPRCAALGFLWVTYQWWRLAITVGTCAAFAWEVASR